MGKPLGGFPNGEARHETTISLVGIVDDDESIRDAISSLLRSVGYRCAVFPSAEAFLDSGQVDETDCVVLDIRMPGLSGLDLQARLRAMKVRIPVIFVTARCEDEVRARAFQDGAAAFLPKPFGEDALLNAIGIVLNGSGN
jgi:FixJ family two-component response regulator